MKKIFSTLSVLSLFLGVLASCVSASNNPSRYSFSLPDKAKKVTPNVYDLGISSEKGLKVQGLAVLHPRPQIAADHKPNHNPGGKNGGGGLDTNTCYTYIANGARWRETEDYYLDPQNNDNYSTSDVTSQFGSAISTWENEVAFNIFGSNLGASGVDGVDTSSTDGKNEIMFGSVSDSNTIAVTIVWYTVGGPPWSRQIVEHDMLFNDEYNWGNAGATSETSLGDTNVMDFLNIATHELGHSTGMGDVYEKACSEATEYGYGTEGETKKRTLEPADITGITELYN